MPKHARHLCPLWGILMKTLGAEHPMDIAMDSTPTPTHPRGPLTRALACAIQTVVTSLLLELSIHLNETWPLPQSGTLCMLRYNDHPLEPRVRGEEADGKLWECTDEKGHEAPGTSGLHPQNFQASAAPNGANSLESSEFAPEPPRNFRPRPPQCVHTL
jgi:hypothetical protein